LLCWTKREAYYPIVPKSDYQPQHQSRAATKGKVSGCKILYATKLLPPYKSKLQDDSSSIEGEEDVKMEKPNNDNNESEIESNVDSSSETIEKDDDVVVEILQRANGRIILCGFSVIEKGCDDIISYAKSWQ